MVTILYTYRNRELSRIKISLDSLLSQTNQGFNVIFIDYGSNQQMDIEIGKLLSNYNFVSYKYLFTVDQLWNKSKALNYALRHLVKTPYFFVSDIDMIFSPKFISILAQLIVEKPFVNVFFKVGYLSKQQIGETVLFKDLKINFESTSEATGLTLFHAGSLKKINGFDEFYHFWGAEDTDVHVRLQNAGYEVSFYDSEILMLHQWHPSYRSTERKVLTNDLQLSGVVQLNHEHLKDAIASKRTIVNHEKWGTSVSRQEYNKLQKSEKQIVLINRKSEIDHFLYFTLKQEATNTTEYRFELDPEQGSLKQNIKKILRKKIPQYYSLKEINDFILVHLISNPSLKNYRYQVAPDLKSISLIF